MNVTSIAGHTAYVGGGGYNAAKFAAHALTEVLRLELNGEPLRVIEVAPGMVKTDEFALVRFGGDRARADAVYDDVPEPLVADDIAAVIARRGLKPAPRRPRPDRGQAGRAGRAVPAREGRPRRARRGRADDASAAHPRATRRPVATALRRRDGAHRSRSSACCSSSPTRSTCSGPTGRSR